MCLPRGGLFVTRTSSPAPRHLYLSRFRIKVAKGPRQMIGLKACVPRRTMTLYKTAPRLSILKLGATTEIGCRSRTTSEAF